MGSEVTVKGRAGLRSRRGQRALSLAFAGAALLAPGLASAQIRTFYLDRLAIAGAPDDGVALWRPEMADKTRFYGQLALGFGFELHASIVSPSVTTSAPWRPPMRAS